MLQQDAGTIIMQEQMKSFEEHLFHLEPHEPNNFPSIIGWLILLLDTYMASTFSVVIANYAPVPGYLHSKTA